MAITGSICSSPNQHPTLPTLPLPPIPPLKTHHPLQLHFPPPSSSSKFGANWVSNDALVIAATAEALALARAAVVAARDAAAVRDEIVEAWSCRESGNGNGGLVVRRKRRRKRRKGLEGLDEERGRGVGDGKLSFGFVRCGHLNPKEEAECCLSLKVNICGMMAKITKAKNSFNQRFKRLPTHDEITEVVNVPAATVNLVCDRSRPLISLDRVVTFRGCMSLQEIMQGPEEMIPEKMLTKQLMKQEVEKLLKTLSNREAYVLRLHF